MFVTLAVMNHKDDVFVQERGIAAICNLASDADEDIIEASNVIEIVRDSLIHHESEVSIQARGLAVLQNLSMRGTSFKKTVAMMDCAKVAVDATRLHAGSSAIVVERAFAVLWNLVSQDGTRQVMFDDDGIRPFLLAMMANITSLRIQMLGCSFLCAMSTFKQEMPDMVQIKERIREEGGVDALLFAMAAHYSSERVQDMCCRAFSCLSLDREFDDDGGDGDDEGALTNEYEIDALVEAMNHFPDRSNVQYSAVLAIRNFSMRRENVGLIREIFSSLEMPLKTASRRFPDKCSERVNEIFAEITGG